MIITRQKPFSEILEHIGGAKKVFLVGCTLCATVCKTGGEAQLRDMENALQKAGKTVTGWAVLDPACNLLEIKRLYRKRSGEIDAAEVILSLACGGGTQAIVEIIGEKQVLPGNNTLFQGEITKLTLKEAQFDQKCSLCGDCILDETGGICPVTRCPKSLMNGPCGGAKDGKCEVNNDLDCVWILIYNRLKKFGRLNEMKKIRVPRDYSRNKNPQDLIIK
ncbi:MAG: 5,10-methylenetetrahydrofolate reductase [Candidatus Makaraimicrobium thalassicum]|nr:MAG: 5,10-methylenetetrahydrofolate reductase [Candidatus Omnitrophota bacterium]